MKKNFIKIWAQDFDQDVWEEYCDACNVPYDTTHIRIYFDDEDIEYDNSQEY
jgi:hypothetical protein